MGGGKRVRHLFTGVAQGECDITIKIRTPEPNAPSDIYKLVLITIEKLPHRRRATYAGSRAGLVTASSRIRLETALDFPPANV